MPSRETPSQTHSSHDALLVARYAVGDAYPTEIDRAQDLVDGCTLCASLAADVRLISARTGELPQIKRPRDFRITTEQAESLRGSWLDRLMRGIAAPGWTIVRPLAGAALAIALVFVVVGALPLGNLRGGAAPEAAPAAAPALSSGAFSADQASPPQNPSKASSGLPSPINDTELHAPSTAAAPGGIPTTPQSDASSTGAPGAGMSMASEMPTDFTNAPEIAPPSAQSAPPAKSIESPEPPPPQATAASQAIAASPAAQPSPAPAAALATGNALVGSSSANSVDRTALVAGGLLLGFIALMSLAFVWVVRRRYSDPLVR